MEKQGALSALGTLSQETRLDVFRLLVAEGPAGLAAGVIADRLGVLPASLTFHLQQLGAALATVVGVQVEVPVMLSVVRLVLRSRVWYERTA